MANKYGKRSKKVLSEIHFDLQTVFSFVLQFFDHSLVCGRRGKAAQTKAYNSGKSKLKWPESKHNAEAPALSNAVDAYPYPVNFKRFQRQIYFAGAVVGIAWVFYKIGKIDNLIRWGGDWNKNTILSDQSFNDYPHFEVYKPKGVKRWPKALLKILTK